MDRTPWKTEQKSHLLMHEVNKTIKHDPINSPNCAQVDIPFSPRSNII